MIGGAHAKRLAKALEELQAATSPVDRLDPVRRLREAADKLERAHIDAARAAGLTWSEIGEVYGLSKQGAQQRFRKRRGKK